MRAARRGVPTLPVAMLRQTAISPRMGSATFTTARAPALHTRTKVERWLAAQGRLIRPLNAWSAELPPQQTTQLGRGIAPRPSRHGSREARQPCRLSRSGDTDVCGWCTCGVQCGDP